VHRPDAHALPAAHAEHAVHVEAPALLKVEVAQALVI